MAHAFDIKRKIQVFWRWEYAAVGPSALMREDMELCRKCIRKNQSNGCLLVHPIKYVNFGFYFPEYSRLIPENISIRDFFFQKYMLCLRKHEWIWIPNSHHHPYSESKFLEAYIVMMGARRNLMECWKKFVEVKIDFWIM